MKSVLEELFYGNIDPNTTGFDRGTAYGKAVKRISDNEEKLSGLLGEPAKSIFFDFANAYSEVNGLTAMEKFTYGFKLGALLMIEVMGQAGSIVH